MPRAERLSVCGAWMVKWCRIHQTEAAGVEPETSARRLGTLVCFVYLVYSVFSVVWLNETNQMN